MRLDRNRNAGMLSISDNGSVNSVTCEALVVSVTMATRLVRRVCKRLELREVQDLLDD